MSKKKNLWNWSPPTILSLFSYSICLSSWKLSFDRNILGCNIWRRFNGDDFYEKLIIDTEEWMLTLKSLVIICLTQRWILDQELSFYIWWNIYRFFSSLKKQLKKPRRDIISQPKLTCSFKSKTEPSQSWQKISIWRDPQRGT